MKSLLNTLQKIENAIMIGTFAIMVFCSFAQVINRNFFHLPIPWFDEAATFSMIYMVLLGTEAGLRDGSQIAVTTLVDKLQGRGKTLIQIIAKSIVTIFSAFVLHYSMNMVSVQAASGQTTPALHLPMSVPYMALVISFAIITCVQGATVIKLAIDLSRGNPKPDEEGVSS